MKHSLNITTPHVKNVVLITLDEVRADHISCYGYERIKTCNIDKLADDGVLLETCITASNYTPPSHASILTGLYPPRHGMREAYTPLQAITIAEILKEHGYSTAAFLGNELMPTKLNFNRGFDYFEEPRIEDPLNGSFKVEPIVGSHIDPHQRPGAESGLFGNWWTNRAINWIKEQVSRSKPFFLWGHCYDTHRYGEKRMLYNGWIKPGELSDFDYYDAKIKCVDERMIGPIFNALKELNIYNTTTIILMSDHGTNLADHPIPWRAKAGWATGPYPEHCTMYEHCIRVMCIIEDESLPKGKRLKGLTRTIDIVPTLLDLHNIKVNLDFDGMDLVPFIEKGESPINEAYIESMWEDRQPGCMQAIRTRKYKYIRNLSTGVEALYDLEEDPKEVCNMLCNVDDFTLPPDEMEKLIKGMRRKLNEMLKIGFVQKGVLGEDERKKLEKRLRQLGYLE